MKTTKWALSLLLVAALAVTAFPQQASDANAPSDQAEYRPGEVVVELRPGAAITDVNARFGTTTIQQIYGTNFYRLRTPKGKKENKWRKRLSKDADVLSAELNPVITYPSLF